LINDGLDFVVFLSIGLEDLLLHFCRESSTSLQSGHYNHIPQSLYTLVSEEMPSIWYTNYHNYLWSSLGWVFVHFLVILFFEWLYHLLKVEFWKTRHHKWIKNGPNSRKAIWLGW
jgi:hypothetical protein